jgi:hypothetical protein
VYQSLDGIEIRFVHGSKTTGQRLSLTFDNVTEAVGRSITDHYDTNGTTYGVFGLPAEVFAGMADYNNTNPAGNDWRYAGPPQVTYGSPGYQSVTVELLGVSS